MLEVGPCLVRVPDSSSRCLIVAAYVNGDGQGDYVFGTADGRVLALSGAVDASRREIWSLESRDRVGHVVVADVDRKGGSAIVTTAGDGYLYVIG